MVCKYTLPTPWSSPAKQVSTAGAADFYLVFAKFGAEVLKLVNLLVIELNRLFPMVFLEAQQAVVFGGQAVTLPQVTDTANVDAEASACANCYGHFYRQPSGHKEAIYFYWT